MSKPTARKESQGSADLGTQAMVALDLIDAGPQPRKTFGDKDLQELAGSMRENGQRTEIKLRPISGGRYLLVCGERRVRAARMLGWRDIKAVVRDMSDEEAAIEQWLENAFRIDVNPIDQAYALDEFKAKTGYSWERIGEIVGMTPSTILARRRLRLIPPEVQQAIRQGKLPSTYGEYLGAIDQDLHPRAVRELIRSHRPSLDEFEAFCKRLQHEKHHPPPPQGTQSLLFEIGEPVVAVASIADSVGDTSGDADPQAELLRPKVTLPPMPKANSLGVALERYKRQLAESDDPAVRDVAWVIESLYQELRRNYLIRTGHKAKK